MDDIVISGISVRFPKCHNMDDLRDNLLSGVDMVTDTDANTRWPPGIYGVPTRSGKLDNLTKFDAQFFSVHENQAMNMDCQLRLMPALAIEAVADSGTNPTALSGTKTAVVVGAAIPETFYALTEETPDTSPFLFIGCDISMLANRVSYVMDLKGPSFSVNSACSTSGTALCQAISLIREGKCESALVGGVVVNLNPAFTHVLNRMGVLSPDGKCKFLDETADGFARSEACCVIFLQKLSEAKRVYGTILGIQANNDGYTEEGITYPSYLAQYQVMMETLGEADVDPNSVHYIEAHGTGTQAGDRSETEAISKAYCQDRSRPLMVGSVKTNLGHTEMVAALAGIAKVVVIFENKIIPKSLHFEKPNLDLPALTSGLIEPVLSNTSFDDSVIGVNSFGAGGANVHILLRANTTSEARVESQDQGLCVIPLFGRTEDSVKYILNHFCTKPSTVTEEFLYLYNEVSIMDGMEYRDYMVVDLDANDNQLEQTSSKKILEKLERMSEKRPLWLIFPGMGCEWPAMGRALMGLKVFSESVRQSALILKVLDLDLMSLLNNEWIGKPDIVEVLTMVTSMQIGLVDIFAELGIVADGMIGHSLGEIAVGYCDGVLDRRQTLLISYWKAKIFSEVDVKPGMMATVQMSWRECRRHCPDDVFVCCHNSADSVTISGEVEPMEQYLKMLTNDNVFAKQLPSYGYAFHNTSNLQPIAGHLNQHFQEIIIEPKRRSAKWISSSVPEQDWEKEWTKFGSAEYYANNMLSPVLFWEALQSVPNNAIVIEISPHTLFRHIIGSAVGRDCHYIPLMRRNHNQHNCQYLLSAIGQLYKLGFNPHFNKLNPHISYPVKRGTQSISSLIKWDHTRDYPLPNYPEYFHPMRDRKIVFDLNKKENQFYQDHKLNGRVVFPAAGYIVMAWQTVAKVNGLNFNETAIELGDMMIKRATVLKSDHATTFNLDVEKSGKLCIRESGDIVFSCDWRILNGDLASLDDCHELNQEGIELNYLDCYKEYNTRGYDFGAQFRVIREIYTDSGSARLAFTGNWVTFLDGLLQTQLISAKTFHLRVPTYIRSFRLDPKQLRNKSQHNEKETIFDVCCDKNSRDISTTGIELIGVHFNIIRHNSAKPTIFKYQFVPHFSHINSNSLNSFIDNISKQSIGLMKMLLATDGQDVNLLDNFLKKRHFEALVLNNSNRKPSMRKCARPTSDHQKGPDGYVTELFETSYNLAYDVFTQNQLTWPGNCNLADLIEKEHFEEMLLPVVNVACYNCSNDNMKIAELSLDNKGEVFKAVRTIMQSNYNHILYKYTMLITKQVELESQLNSINTLQWNPFQEVYPDINYLSNLVIFRNTNFYGNHNIEELANYLFMITSESGFVACILRCKLTKLEKLMRHITNCNDNFDDSYEDVFVSTLTNNGLTPVANYVYANLIKVVVLRKVILKRVCDQTFIAVNATNFEWIETLKGKLIEHESRPEGHNVWLVADDCPYNGIIGLVNCLKQEPNGHRVRCLFLAKNKHKKPFDPHLYEDIIANDLMMNVIDGGQSGQYSHLTNDVISQKRERKHVFIDVDKLGDLSSFQWFESNHKNFALGQNNKSQNFAVEQKNVKKLIQIYYSALNFKDVMVATGRLPIEDSDVDHGNDHSCIGLEFVGRDQNGQRVMGITDSKAIATTVLVDRDWTWTVPEKWSMEAASTVPVVYCTTLYALLVRGRISFGQSVLIHSGSGGVGLAAIRIAINIGCNIFTTVSSRAKRDYLAQLFPQLNDRCFANSRDTTFERHIMKETNGRGVDLVLNSLSEDKLQASVRCLARNGKFLEIGKFDVMMDNKLGLYAFSRNIEFHGIYLDTLLKSDDPQIVRDKLKVIALLSEGIKSGAVVPLRRTVLDISKTEEAFRYMTSGKHIGKIVIKLRDEEPLRSVIPRAIRFEAKPRTMFLPGKSYIIIGGLGGFGLQLIRWMTIREAKKFVIVSRSGITTGYQQWIVNHVRDRFGCQITMTNHDITTDKGCQLVYDLACAIATVGGIFNLALSLSDDNFIDQTVNSFQLVCSPKVSPVTNFDKLSRNNYDLDYFVCFSSIACGRGLPGQTNYGYANSVMERVCELRRRDGLHGLAIQWGAIGDTGYVWDFIQNNDIEFEGLLLQRINSCLQVLDQFLQSNETIVSSHVISVRKNEQVIKPRVDLLSKICDFFSIRELSAHNMSQTLTDIGMDSLTTVEVKNMFESKGINIPLLKLKSLTLAEVGQMNKEIK